MSVRKQILETEEEKDLIFDYVPKQFPISINQSAKDFVTSQESQATDFKISELVAEQSGIAEVNRKQVEIRVEAEALEKLKEVEERAYSEAYDLGIIEGTEKAFTEYKDELRARIENLDHLLNTFETIKVQLIESNEQQILKLLNLMASKIAMDHIKINKEIILEVIKKVIETAQTDEGVVIRLSHEDNMFIESLRERVDKKMNFLNQVKLEPSDELASGGCILETKYGAIDATLEQRLAKVWEAIEAKMPRVSKEAQNYTDKEELEFDMDGEVETEENVEVKPDDNLGGEPEATADSEIEDDEVGEEHKDDEDKGED